MSAHGMKRKPASVGRARRMPGSSCGQRRGSGLRQRHLYKLAGFVCGVNTSCGSDWVVRNYHRETRLSRSTPLRLLIFAVLISGIGPVLVRESPVGPAATAFWRLAIALPFAISTGRSAFSMAGRDIALALISGVLLAADLVFWNNAILRTSVMEATVLVM